MISAPAGQPGEVSVMRTRTSPGSETSTSYTRPRSMMLRVELGILYRAESPTNRIR